MSPGTVPGVRFGHCGSSYGMSDSNMVYLLIIGGDQLTLAAEEPGSVQECAALVEGWWRTHRAAGQVIGSARLKPAYTATTVRFAGGGPVIIDGSFTSEPDAMGAVALISVHNLDQALAIAGSWPIGGYVEIRPLATPGERLFADVRSGPVGG